MPTFIIAEAGSNHCGDFDQVVFLVEEAVDAGADACKFQYWSSSERLCERRKAPEYFPIYEKYRLPKEWIPHMLERCQTYGIEFMCTVYLPEDIEVVAPYVKRFKVSSFEANDWEFLEVHRRFEKQIIVSSGMATLDDVISSARKSTAWFLRWDDVLMQCTSSYPCPDEEASIATVKELYRMWKSDFGRAQNPVGLSDHTKNPLTGALAVACGATYIETHFRLENTPPDAPDYAVSRSPEELRQYIANIRQAEILLGDGIKKVMPSEEPMLRYKVGG